MNQFEYISTITTNLHGHIESWARICCVKQESILQKFMVSSPEGTVASHIVLFPIVRIIGKSNLATGTRYFFVAYRYYKIPVELVPPLWTTIGRAIVLYS